MGFHPQDEVASLVRPPDGDDELQAAITAAFERRTAEHAAQPVQRTPFARPLNAGERTLLGFLAARNIAEQTGFTLDEAFDALSAAAGEGQVILDGDNVDVRITLRGRAIVACTREWLAFRASWPGDDPWRDRRWKRVAP